MVKRIFFVVGGGMSCLYMTMAFLHSKKQLFVKFVTYKCGVQKDVQSVTPA
jgi:hypothetical protein